MKRLLVIAAGTLIAGYLAICALLFTQQRKLIFPAPASKAPAVRRIAPGDAGPIVVFFHGNADCAGEQQWLADQLGHSFVAVEYPGYGALPGSPSEEAIYTAAEAQLQGLPRERLVLVGQSIGSGPAVELARRGYGRKLVLLSPFTSLPDAAQLTLPWLPARWLTRDRFDSASKAPGISVPVLVIHGDRDEVVPYPLGARLAPLFPHGELMTISGAHHNDLWDHREVIERVRAFL
ncbi:MAG: alpha/beta hydrolase [Archangiaceae bacterium]|nr:alpha/beta hydrolase [Archangiaceae bacterium]